jgi:dTDP-glucose pyrophosphorylase
MKLLLPIAGRGSRFAAQADKNLEYKKPKPLINVRGFPMVRWATGSLPFVEHTGQKVIGDFIIKSKDIVFVALKEHDKNYNMGEVLKSIYGNDIKIIFLDEVTRGAAETALQAKEFINNSEPLIISDSDHFFDGEALFNVISENPGIDGVIPVFEVLDGNPKWSFSRLAENGYVDLVAEKQPISTWANIGAYYFGQGKNFVEIAEETINKNELTNKEFYIAPLYNKLIARGGKVKLAFPKYVYGLGTPDDLEYFLNNTNYKL